MQNQPGAFVWHELITTDTKAASAFYATVVGWTPRDAGMPGADYTLLEAGGTPVGGLMALPPDAGEGGPGWIGYVAVPDVDAAARDVAEKGGTVRRAAEDIPGIGRFAVAADPQGAAFVLFRPSGEPYPAVAPGTPGRFAWNELHAGDRDGAVAFYEHLLGWRKTSTFDMGPMGLYQMVGVPDGPEGTGGECVAMGAVMTKSPNGPGPVWLFYVEVEDIDAAAARIASAGGAVTIGPDEIPGGAYVLHGKDPQGAAFALLGPRLS